MLDKQVFSEEISKLLAVYPSWNIDFTDSKTSSIWYEQFKEYTDEQFAKGVKKHIQTVQYNPTVASLYNTCGEPIRAVKGTRYREL